MITVRPTELADMTALDALFEERFGHSLTTEQWVWKYQHLPGQARSVVAVDGAGRVTAHAGALRLAARWRGGESGIWQLVDFVGRPTGGGLRPALVELGRQLLADLPGPEDAPWIFGFPSERHFRLGERVFGYRPVKTISPLAAPLAAPEIRGTPEMAEILATRAATGTPETPENDSGQGHLLSVGDSCGEWAAAIWERLEICGVRRSAAFLNWRYWARPRRYYRFYRLRSAGEEGLAVFALVGDEAWAVELWLPPAGEWYAPMLAVAADLRASGLRLWRFWPPPAAVRRGVFTAAAGATAADLLHRLGLRPQGEPRFVGCRGATAGAVDPVLAAKDFYYAMGDHDVV